MSRSYKKARMITDKNNKFLKKYANRSLRNKLKNSDEILNGSTYKKHFESWDICDYKWYWSLHDAIKFWEVAAEDSWVKKQYPTLRSWLKYYNKCVYYK